MSLFMTMLAIGISELAYDPPLNYDLQCLLKDVSFMNLDNYYYF